MIKSSEYDEITHIYCPQTILIKIVWIIIFFYYKFVQIYNPPMPKKGKYNKNQPDEEQPRKKKIMITEEHLMDKTHMDTTDFLPLIPSDSLYPPFGLEHVNILRKIVKDLNYLLYAKFKNFWATMLYNPTLKNCLNTSLRFLHRSWLNLYYDDQNQRRGYYDLIKDRQEYELTSALMKIVLVIHFRILNAPDENPQLTSLYRLTEEISNKFILDFPRMMQLIEIYGESNPEIVKVMVKAFLGLNPNFYADLKGQYMQILIEKMNRDLNALKKIGDRQQFGIQYSYKRNNDNDLSPGEEQLKRKINLLMQFVSFYRMLDDINTYFPEQISEFIRFNEDIHTLSENLFIQIQQAYKTWNNQDVGNRIYPLMNHILKKIVAYFVDFLNKCDHLFVKRTMKSNTIGAYMKCLDRMLQFYGRRASLGKKASNKRYMELYNQILKHFKLDQFLSAIYVEEIENGTYGINIEYLVDFKLAVDEQVIRANGGRREIQHHEGLGEMGPQDQQLTQAGQNQQQFEEIPGGIEKIASRKQSHNDDLQALQKIVSKRNRNDNYYHGLYNQYRSKYTTEYEDQYDDLVDYQKRPMFEDIDKQELNSSDGSFDSEQQQLHLVKSQSNVSRNRTHIGGSKQMQANKYQQHDKYDRKNKAKYVAVKGQDIQKMLNKNNQQKMQTNQKKLNNNKGYMEKTEQTHNIKEYDDEECFQDCKAKIKMEEQDTTQRPQKSNNNYKGKEKNKNNYKGEGEGGKAKKKSYVEKKQ